MRALACPGSLKEVLTPIEAAALLAAGMRRVDGLEVDELPVADGGEGTAEVLARTLGGEWHTAVVSDPFGRPVAARYLLNGAILPDLQVDSHDVPAAGVAALDRHVRVGHLALVGGVLI